MKKLRISRLFHWLYAILMLFPFGYFVFNLVGNCFNQSANFNILDFESYLNLFLDFFDSEYSYVSGGLATTIHSVYFYLFYNVFGLIDDLIVAFFIDLLTYWTCISLIWLVFDIIMYVPMLVHSWLDRASIGG